MDVLSCPPAGFVRLLQGGTVVLSGQNLVTDAAIEVILRSLLESDHVRSVVFADVSGQVVTAAARALPGVLASSPVELTGDLAPEVARDLSGLQTVATWRAVLDPAAPLTFDCLGLVSNAGLLVAALPILARTTVPGTPLVVEWTLAVRGAGSYRPGAV